MPAGQYLRLLDTHPVGIYRRGPDWPSEPVAAVWALSFQRVQEENPAAGQLLDLCAYLAPEPIPLDLFTGHTDELPEPLASAAGDELRFADVLGVIIDYSLGKRSPDGLQLHRLVQAALRAREESVAQP